MRSMRKKTKNQNSIMQSQNQESDLFKSVVLIKKMDCPSEVQLIKALFPNKDEVSQMNFDLGAREVSFFHFIEAENILDKLASINLNGTLLDSKPITEGEIEKDDSGLETKTLKILLAINFSMFLFEIAFGIISDSTGLIADSLDMLADSLVYGVSLYAVGKVAHTKNKAAFVSGILQMALALGCLFEVARRFIFGSDPISSFMVVISSIALLANVACLFLIYKHKDGGVHMKASWIFSANDVIANTGVLLAGLLVALTGSRYPDLAIGMIVALVVFRGAIQILKLSRLEAGVGG